jgi:hypothetical protein
MRLAPSVAGDAIGLYLIGWAIFTAYMTIAALNRSAAHPRRSEAGGEAWHVRPAYGG